MNFISKCFSQPSSSSLQPRAGRSAWVLSLLSLSLGLSSCTTLKHADTTQFYVLTASKAEASSAVQKFEGLLYVAPVELASYLDQPGLVIRQGTNRLHFAERRQWGQPLHDNITEVLREDFAGLLGNEHVHPWGRQRPRGAFVSLQIRVDQFELADLRRAALTATWQLSDGETGHRLTVQSSHIEQPLSQELADFPSHVTILSDTLAQLAREIATALASAK